VQSYNAQAVVTPQQIILAAEVTTDANDVQQLKPMLDLAQAVVEMVMGEDAVLGAAAADAGYWSENNAASQTVECELFIATRQDRQQRAELRAAPAPRGRMPKGFSARERMQRKLRTRRGPAPNQRFAFHDALARTGCAGLRNRPVLPSLRFAPAPLPAAASPAGKP
jgi:hypothetical protein